MHIYFCGIGGAGLAPLAMLCRDIGWTVSGSDTAESLNTTELKTRDIDFELDQSGNYLQKTHHDYPVDWFVYSSAVTDQNQEYLAAKKMGQHETLDRFGTRLLMVRHLEVSFPKPRRDFTKPRRLRNF